MGFHLKVGPLHEHFSLMCAYYFKITVCVITHKCVILEIRTCLCSRNFTYWGLGIIILGKINE